MDISKRMIRSFVVIGNFLNRFIGIFHNPNESESVALVVYPVR